MKPVTRYLFLLIQLAIASWVSSCDPQVKRMNKRVTLYRNDKIPYGTWYAYEQLKNIFPKSEVHSSKRSPDRSKRFTGKKSKNDNFNDNNNDNSSYDNQRTSYIIIANHVVPDENEVSALLNMVGQGQTVFISSLRIGEALLDSLRLKTAFYTSFYNAGDSLTVSVNNPETNDSLSYSYPGFALDNYIVSMDSSITTILGKDKYGRANFVRFSYVGGGSLFIHLAPMAFTNFFLLHKENKSYFDNVFSYLPQSTEVVRWDDYFRNNEAYGENQSTKNKSFNAFGWAMGQKGLKEALPLLILLLLIIYLFESKRKQRVIPVIPPLKNASLDFVKTIGRLYFQRHDNKNLAQKITVHFQDHVRSRYGIRTSLRDPDFEQRLAWKTGYDVFALKDLLYQMNMLQDEWSVSDEALLELNTKLEHFYKHA